MYTRWEGESRRPSLMICLTEGSSSKWFFAPLIYQSSRLDNLNPSTQTRGRSVVSRTRTHARGWNVIEAHIEGLMADVFLKHNPVWGRRRTVRVVRKAQGRGVTHSSRRLLVATTAPQDTDLSPITGSFLAHLLTFINILPTFPSTHPPKLQLFDKWVKKPQ